MLTSRRSNDGPVLAQPEPTPFPTMDYSLPVPYALLIKPFNAVVVARKRWVSFMGLTPRNKNYEYKSCEATLLATSSGEPLCFQTPGDTRPQLSFLPKNPELEDFFFYQVSQVAFDIVQALLPPVRWFAFMGRLGCETEAHENPVVLTIHLDTPKHDARISGRVASRVVEAVLAEIGRNDWQGEEIRVDVARNRNVLSPMVETYTSVDESYSVDHTLWMGQRA